MEHNLSQIASSYKLNSSIVKRMTSRVIIDSHRNEHPGCSKLMIAAMIHFSHICSTKGVIERIKVSELSFVLRCNIRSAYTVLAELEKREFISVETVDSWNGIKRIIIHDNDYSSVSNYSNVRYLNTNYPFFNYRESNGYVKFLNLSLFSMRLLLLLLLNYKPSYGYRVSYDTACAQLSVKKSFRVHKYMKELEDVLGPNFFVSGKSSNTRRKKHDVIVVVKGQDALTPDKFFSTTQDTYYSFCWKQKLLSYGFNAFTKAGSLHYYACRLCGIVITFLQKKISLTLIENTIVRILLEQYILDEQTLTDIYRRLEYLCE